MAISKTGLASAAAVLSLGLLIGGFGHAGRMD